MAHVDRYHNGKKLVSVTELQSIVVKPFLEKWKQGLCEPNNSVCGFVKARQVAEEAGEFGTKIHEEIENWFKGQEPVSDWAIKIKDLYIEHKVKPAIIEPEETLIDEESGLAGSPDHVIEWDGEVVIGDLKIKNSLDSLTAFQGCGYKYLIKRKFGVDIKRMLVTHCKKKTVSKIVEPTLIDLDPWMADWASLVAIWNRVNPSRKVTLHW